MKKRVFSREVKLEAVRMVLSGRRPAAQIARELGISAHLLYTWKKTLQAEVTSGTQPSSPDLEKELKRLQRENAELREEREFLKKATAFFAKNPR